MFRSLRQLSFFLAFAAVGATAAPVKEYKPGWNLFSKEQDVQLGREAAAQVEQQMPVLRDQQLQSYVEDIGRKLARSKYAGEFPYSFKVINDPSINAFALPGGPTFVHTGLIKAAENEAQLAGVIAHEIAHVALRHGTNQASKANLIQLPAMLAGAVIGNGSLLGQLAQVGIGLGAQSVLLRYSRDAEKQADLMGALMMADAGYNPIEMARFFEKLAAQSGSRGSSFFSDHPDPGNRSKYVEEQVRALPQRNYTENGSGGLAQAQARVSGLPAPTKARAANNGQVAQGDPRPSGQSREYRNSAFAIQHPGNWEAFGDQGGAAVTIAPRSGLVQDRSGNVAVAYGVMVSFAPPLENSRADLRQQTSVLIGNLRQNNPGLQVQGNQKSTRVAGQTGIVTTLVNQSPLGGREIDMLVTVNRPQGLLYLIFIAPEKDYSQLQSVFGQMLQSVRF
ncbi:MAG: M48 family metallopeptidase [Bryobacteraceae bacterium]|nr:M48 family metallopeptidase [Bryobacteraceae bacterium]